MRAYPLRPSLFWCRQHKYPVSISSFSEQWNTCMGKSCVRNMTCCMQWYTSCISLFQNDLANYFIFLLFCLLINGLANFLVMNTFFKNMNYWLRPKKKYWVLKFRQEHSLCRSQTPSKAVLLVYSHLWTSFYRFDLSKSHPTNHDSSL